LSSAQAPVPYPTRGDSKLNCLKLLARHISNIPGTGNGSSLPVGPLNHGVVRGSGVDNRHQLVVTLRAITSIAVSVLLPSDGNDGARLFYIFPLDFSGHQPTIRPNSRLNAPLQRLLAPTSAQTPLSPARHRTVAAKQIPIAPADRAGSLHAVSFIGGFRTPADRPTACCALSERAGVRNPSH
jgi:hypothetical protein